MSKFANGKIYKIQCKITGECYIGSTIVTLSKRISTHKASYKRWLNGHGYKFSSYPIIERNDYEITLVENFPCDIKYHLLCRERYYIEHTPNCINKNIPSRTPSERGRSKYAANPEIKKAYYEANKQRILAYQKEYHARKKQNEDL
jgi:hypothetical protein